MLSVDDKTKSGLSELFSLISLIFEDTLNLSSDLLVVGYSQHR